MKFKGTLELKTLHYIFLDKDYDSLVFTFDDGHEIKIEDNDAIMDFLRHAYQLQKETLKKETEQNGIS